MFKNWTLKRIHNFCPIRMKLGENDYHMRQLFSLSFIRIGQKLWNFYKWPFFERVRFFLTQTLLSLDQLTEN